MRGFTDEGNAQKAMSGELKQSFLEAPFAVSMHAASYQAAEEPSVVELDGPHTLVLPFQLPYYFQKRRAPQGSFVLHEFDQ